MSDDNIEIVFEAYPIEQIDLLTGVNDLQVDVYSNNFGNSGYIRAYIDAHYDGDPRYFAISVPANNLMRREPMSLILAVDSAIRDLTIIQSSRNEGFDLRTLPAKHSGRLIHIAQKHNSDFTAEAAVRLHNLIREFVNDGVDRKANYPKVYVSKARSISIEGEEYPLEAYIIEGIPFFRPNMRELPLGLAEVLKSSGGVRKLNNPEQYILEMIDCLGIESALLFLQLLILIQVIFPQQFLTIRNIFLDLKLQLTVREFEQMYYLIDKC